MGLSENESLHLFRKFCKGDHRFNNHLIAHHDLPAKKSGLMHIIFIHNVNLISFIKDLDVQFSISTMEPPILNKTYIGVLYAKNQEDVDGLSILVNPNESFTTAFFSVYRDLIMARKFLEWISNGDIKAETNYDDFTNLYRSEYNIFIDGLAKDLEAHFAEWLNSEGLSIEAKEWLDREIEYSTMDINDVPLDVKNHMKYQIDILYEVIPKLAYLYK